LANDTLIYNSASGDISVLNDFATGNIKFAAGGSSTAQMTLHNTGNLLLGSTTNSGERLQVTGDVKVTGSGAISSTIPFVVRNSAGTELLKVFGNGQIYLPQPAGTNLFLNQISGYNSDTIATGTSRFICGGGFSGINASAQFEIVSTTRGFLPPRMTTTQKNAISSPAAGLVVYDTTLAKLCVYTTAWETITSI
jgi:hypothetical protein